MVMLLLSSKIMINGHTVVIVQVNSELVVGLITAVRRWISAMRSKLCCCNAGTTVEGPDSIETQIYVKVSQMLHPLRRRWVYSNCYR